MYSSCSLRFAHHSSLLSLRGSAPPSPNVPCRRPGWSSYRRSNTEELCVFLLIKLGHFVPHRSSFDGRRSCPASVGVSPPLQQTLPFSLSGFASLGKILQNSLRSARSVGRQGSAGSEMWSSRGYASRRGWGTNGEAGSRNKDHCVVKVSRWLERKTPSLHNQTRENWILKKCVGVRLLIFNLICMIFTKEGKINSHAHTPFCRILPTLSCLFWSLIKVIKLKTHSKLSCNAAFYHSGAPPLRRCCLRSMGPRRPSHCTQNVKSWKK